VRLSVGWTSWCACAYFEVAAMMGCKDVGLIALWRSERLGDHDRPVRQATPERCQATSDRGAAPRPFACGRRGGLDSREARLVWLRTSRPILRWRGSNPVSAIEPSKSSQIRYVPGWAALAIAGLPWQPARPRTAAFSPGLGRPRSEPLRRAETPPRARGARPTDSIRFVPPRRDPSGSVACGMGFVFVRAGSSRSGRSAASWARGGRRRPLVQFAPARIASARRHLGTPRARAAAGASEQDIAPRSKEA